MDIGELTAAHTLIASDRVEGTPVRRSDGQRIGTIQRLMIDKATGRVAYAVLSFGGFLGIGQKHIPIPWSRLHYDPRLAAYEIDVSDDDVASMQADEAFDWGDRSGPIDLRGFERMPGIWGGY